MSKGNSTDNTITPDEEKEEEELEGAYGISTKSYDTVSVMAFIMIAIFAFLSNFFISVLIISLAPTSFIISLGWTIVLLLGFLVSYRNLNKSNNKSILTYVFIFTSALFIGSIGNTIALIVSGGGAYSALGGLGGIFYAYWKLQDKGMM